MLCVYVHYIYFLYMLQLNGCFEIQHHLNAVLKNGDSKYFSLINTLVLNVHFINGPKIFTCLNTMYFNVIMLIYSIVSNFFLGAT